MVANIFSRNEFRKYDAFIDKQINKISEIPEESKRLLEVRHTYIQELIESLQFSETLEDLLKKYVLNQKQYADQLKVAESELSHWINGESSPSQKNLNKILKKSKFVDEDMGMLLEHLSTDMLILTYNQKISPLISRLNFSEFYQKHTVPSFYEDNPSSWFDTPKEIQKLLLLVNLVLPNSNPNKPPYFVECMQDVFPSRINRTQIYHTLKQINEQRNQKHQYNLSYNTVTRWFGSEGRKQLPIVLQIVDLINININGWTLKPLDKYKLLESWSLTNYDEVEVPSSKRS